MSATRTLTPEAPITVSDREQAPTTKRNRGWFSVAVAATIVASVGIGFGISGTAGDDGSYQVAETQRMNAVAAEYQRQSALAGGTVIDNSNQHAETQRQSAIAPGTDASSETAEYQRQSALAGGSAVDTSSQYAETQRMQALDDVSSDEAEAQRFTRLDPAGS